MVHITTKTSADINMNGEKMEGATSFKYYGATMSMDGTSNTLVRIGIAMATAAMISLSRLLTRHRARHDSQDCYS
ncbi:hypothetical protein DPMN_135314 [Dreissena polymorpha]|uniref:Uncharacterized protein n=1 Tax=Dreissena polymorpha TaxID=45954 RepID=A0A9D4G1L5_DREPO|nr:hypothetical protein DPMN_135314 [Dreissena polymorpha]